MTLSQLLCGVEHTRNIEDCEICTLTNDSRQVEIGSMFFAIAGQKFDGHNHVADAIEKGASAVVVQRDMGVDNQILVNDVRAVYGIVCGNFFDNPAKKLKLMGVTGTNGKTTITYLIKQILEYAGKRVGLIGTIHNEISDMRLPAKHTTPDPMQLHAMLSRMVDAKCEYVVMEVSSHALEQHRIAGCHFITAAFTNLTQDHLDYHLDMESYYQAKKKLFEQCENAIINMDDKYGERLLKEIPCHTLTYSCINNEAMYIAHNINFSAEGSKFAFLADNKLARVNFCMPGKFSVSNALAAAASCLCVGIDFNTVIDGLAQCKGVPGRIEILPTNTPYTIIRDYAHSPDGLKNVLETIREFAPARVVTLFGCAGNRDSTKRPLMAEIVARYSNYVILTSDNPRDESPQKIADDALPGLKKERTPYKVILDRYQAIKWALENSQPQDILVLAGKGHEDYQVLDYGTIYFDEKEIVMEFLNQRDTGPTRSTPSAR